VVFGPESAQSRGFRRCMRRELLAPHAVFLQRLQQKPAFMPIAWRISSGAAESREFLSATRDLSRLVIRS